MYFQQNVLHLHIILYPAINSSALPNTEIYTHKNIEGQSRSEIEKGRAARSGKDEGKGRQTRSLQKREGRSKKQVGQARNGKEKKKRDQPGQGYSEQEGHGKGGWE